MAAKGLSSSRNEVGQGAGNHRPAPFFLCLLGTAMLGTITGCGWLLDQARKPKPCKSEWASKLPCTEITCATLLDSGVVHVIRTSSIVDTLRKTGAPRLLMVVSSGCPGITEALPRLLEEAGRANVQPMVVFQDDMRYLDRARTIAMEAGWRGRLYGLDQRECGCYMDNRERNRFVLDALGIQRPELYHLASSIFILSDSAGNPVAASQYWEYPPRDPIVRSTIQPVARPSQ